MNTIRYSLKHVFARDIALKMNYGSSFDLVKLKKVTTISLKLIHLINNINFYLISGLISIKVLV